MLALLGCTLAYAALSLSVTNTYYQLILTLVPIWAVVGLSWNLFSGYSGLTSFGHAAFFGIGAYTDHALPRVSSTSRPGSVSRSAPCSAAWPGFLIGLPTLRLRGHYFALAMLAYPIVFLYVLQYLGLQEVSLPMKREHAAAFLQFADPRLYTMVALGLLPCSRWLASIAVENTRFGLALMAIRQNELAAEAAGLNTWSWKIRGLVASGAMAAAAGGLYACVQLHRYAGIGVRRHHLRPGAHGDHVRRRRPPYGGR